VDVVSQPHVVVIGAGFGGLAVARSLGDDVRVTIIDQNNFHTFQPLLYQVATAGLNAADVAHSVRGLFHGDGHVGFRRGRVVGLDGECSQVLIEEQDPIDFDHLVVAAGAATNYFGVEGAAEHALPLYNLADAARLRNHILECFETTQVNASAIEAGALCFTIIGGGPTGVETAGALAELIDAVLRKDFPDLDLDQVVVRIVERERNLLGPFSPTSQRHADDTLTSLGVDIRYGVGVQRVGPRHVELDTGERIDTWTTIWAAGVKANPLVDVLGFEQGPAGRIRVDADLSVPGHCGVWAIGDIAHITGDDGALPQLAPVAMQTGAHVAAQIGRVIDGRPTQPFSYTDKGTMATIGRRSAVAELPFGIQLWGTPAWFAWLALHLVFLVGRRNRLSVLLNWGWNYLTWDRGPRLIFRPDDKPAGG
jgi:NADH dehydrogenase